METKKTINGGTIKYHQNSDGSVGAVSSYDKKGNFTSISGSCGGDYMQNDDMPNEFWINHFLSEPISNLIKSRK